jgi:hypothetical protein
MARIKEDLVCSTCQLEIDFGNSLSVYERHDGKEVAWFFCSEPCLEEYMFPVKEWSEDED